jgi:histidinol-phosphatase (PHP family)
MPKIIKRDGHTHTHYCLHASGEHAEEYVRRAIEKGFTMYSFTEHLPFPDSFWSFFPYSEGTKRQLGLRDNDLDGYFREMYALKKKYRDRIELKVGLEIDFLPTETAYLRRMLKEYGKFLEDGLLSVHIIEGCGGFRCVDVSPADFEEGVIKHYGSYEEAQKAYFQTVKEALRTDLGPYKPKRIGHFTLCNKFQCYFGQEGKMSEATRNLVVDLLKEMKEQGYSLDVNVAGLFKEYCREIYLSPWIVQAAKQLGIPLVYGSDAHASSQVGRAYEEYEQIVGEKIGES